MVAVDAVIKELKASSKMVTTPEEIAQVYNAMYYKYIYFNLIIVYLYNYKLLLLFFIIKFKITLLGCNYLRKWR